MGLKAWLIPQEKRFFDLLDRQMSFVREGTTVLRDMVEDKDGKGPAHYQQVLEEVEHRGDDTVHDIYHALNQTFITPIDREDIISLTSTMDDVLDHIHDAARRMIIYGVDPRKDEVIGRLSGILCESAEDMTKALRGIRRLPAGEEMDRHIRHLHQLENDADDVHLDALGGLFNGNGLDPVTIMKRKEIYDMLEAATDMCEDVANVIGDIVVKHA